MSSLWKVVYVQLEFVICIRQSFLPLVPFGEE